MRSQLRSLVATVALLLCAGLQSQAIDLITPTGLNQGDSFRFIFVSTSQVTYSSSLSVLQNIVTNDASGYTYNGQSVTWNLIGSQTGTNAKDYIGGYNTNVPVYLVTGDKVANDLTTTSGGLWSGALLRAVNAGIAGTIISSNIITGTNASGNLGSSLASSVPTYGNSSLTTGGWVNSGYAAFGSNGPFRVYGISSNLTATVPEPSTYALATIATGVMAAIARRRKARKG